MARELSLAELHELLAAYALDAVDPDERAQIEAWLERAPTARREVDELIETASLLYSEDPTTPEQNAVICRLGLMLFAAPANALTAAHREELAFLADSGRLFVAGPEAGPTPLVVDLDRDLVREVLAEL